MADFQRLLIVEDTPSLARTFEAHLGALFDSVEIVETGAEALSSVASVAPSAILLDLKLPDANGLDLLRRWVGEKTPAPIVVITANASMSTAIEAMREGASDFVVKPASAERLKVTIRNAIESFQLKTVVAQYEAEVDRTDFCGIVGRSLVMQGVYKTIEAAAASKASVFITGETGTGKELVARAVHSLSPRRKGRFVALNCGAIPRDLMESEIFGHVKGAFTGATADRVGAADLADGGTLFLDELGELPIDLQPKLLRFLQLGEYSKVGETRMRKADIRIVAATNRDPLSAVREGRLREDLYYRLHVIPVALPPLRERGGDILLLADAFLSSFARDEGKTFSGFSRAAEEWLVSHAWPGNVRELENLARQIAVMCPSGEIDRRQLPSAAAPAGRDFQHSIAGVEPLPSVLEGETRDLDGVGLEPLWMTERRAIERAIAVNRGNIVAAAKQLQINPSTIYRKRAAWADAQPLSA